MIPMNDRAPVLEAIAQQEQINLYQRFTESEASAILGLSVQTLRRIRVSGDIAYLRVSERHVRFFGFQLCEYLISKIEDKSCPDMALTRIDSKLETIGYQSNPEVLRGVEHGTTTAPSKRDEFLSAQRILKKRKTD